MAASRHVLLNTGRKMSNEIIVLLEELKVSIDAIEAKLDAPDDYKADVSALATAAALTARHIIVMDALNSLSNAHYSTIPHLAEPKTITSAAVAWTYGGYVEIIPVDTIPKEFMIVGIHMDSLLPQILSSQVEIGTGAAGSEVTVAHLPFGRVYVSAQGAQYGTMIMLPVSLKLPANTRVALRIADNVAGAKGYPVKLIVAINP